MKVDTSLYYDNLTQAVSFAGDYASVLELEKIRQEKPTESWKENISKLMDIPGEFTYTDARKYILSKAKAHRVVMINEAHNKPQHRAFTASLLEDLYQQGFRYLAMEMLYNYKRTAVTRLNALTGHYTAEPVAGELVRKALELGYTLVPYEDTVSNHTVKQREYAQAENLYNFLKMKDTTAKMLVHAGYGHIEKGSDNDAWIPMAAYFTLISGINPFTIDQTHMTENSVTAYEAAVYDSWIKKHPINTASVALIDNQPLDLFDTHLYDIHIIHPPTTYRNGRPAWMAMNGWKKETPVNPAYQSLFMVQAYYEKEYNEKTVNQSIPADQTYTNAPNGLYYLYLRKGKYKLLFRDKEYKILGLKDLVVD